VEKWVRMSRRWKSGQEGAGDGKSGRDGAGDGKSGRDGAGGGIVGENEQEGGGGEGVEGGIQPSVSVNKLKKFSNLGISG
jgi:hypothetical protein